MQITGDIFQPITLKRYAAGTWAEGRYVEGAETTVSLVASVQSLSPWQMLHLPEGSRTKDNIVIWTETMVQTADEVAGHTADVIVWDGKLWEVDSVEHWHITPELTHYKATASKLQKT